MRADTHINEIVIAIPGVSPNLGLKMAIFKNLSPKKSREKRKSAW